MTVYQMGRNVLLDEWRLQWRGIANWVGHLLFLAVIMSLHPVWESGVNGYDPVEAARIWTDRAVLIGALYSFMIAPFVLERVRRIHGQAIEMSKPFAKQPYVLGKFGGAMMPLFLVWLPLSGVLNLIVTLVTTEPAPLLPLLAQYVQGYLLLIGPSLLFLGVLGFWLSLRLPPIVIVPLLLLYLERTTLSQQAANAQFSWLSPIVRLEYFLPGHVIPLDMQSHVFGHQLLYLTLAILLMLFSVRGFRRRGLTQANRNRRSDQRRRRTLPAIPIGKSLRRFWGPPVVAALVMSLLTPTIALDPTNEFTRVTSAIFSLEFYFSLVGLLLITGVVMGDKNVGILDLVLTKPMNRWRLLGQRLLPALGVFVITAVVLTWAIHAAFVPLPLGKAFMVAIVTGLYLGAVGLTAANLTHNAMIGYGVGVIYWLLEAGFRGKVTAPFFLLMASHQPDAGPFWLATDFLWLSSKIGLLLLAVWLFILNGWLIDQGPGRRRAVVVLAVTVPGIFALGWWIMPHLMG